MPIPSKRFKLRNHSVEPLDSINEELKNKLVNKNQNKMKMGDVALKSMN